MQNALATQMFFALKRDGNATLADDIDVLGTNPSDPSPRLPAKCCGSAKDVPTARHRLCLPLDEIHRR